jgi:hypothetical protein
MEKYLKRVKIKQTIFLCSASRELKDSLFFFFHAIDLYITHKVKLPEKYALFT